MDLPGVNPRRLIAQPVEDREPVAGSHASTPVVEHSEVEALNETDISVRKWVKGEARLEDGSRWRQPVSGVARSLSSEEEMVVDMQHIRPIQNCVQVRQAGLSENDLSINVRVDRSSCNAVEDSNDLRAITDVELDLLKQKGSVQYGDDKDIRQLLDKMPAGRGVICRVQQVLCCDSGVYAEGEQYEVMPGNKSKGAFGEAVLCRDLKTGKTFMRKTVKGQLSRNEIEVPLMFPGNPCVPEVYGVNIKDPGVEIFQEFAGLSMKMIMELSSDHARRLCDPNMVLLLAFQGFSTLNKLHSQGVTHQDIKPENLCLDMVEKMWRLKLIDYGSSQTPKDHTTEGLTNEYLSPESCRTILQVATQGLPKELARLGPGTDVWALGLSLLYCLCGYHVMVYVCTGQTRYVDQHPAKLQRQRMQCLLQIAQLSNEEMERKLIHPDWPDVLKQLLRNVLRVDPSVRWTAEQAAGFILKEFILKGMQMQRNTQAASLPASATSGERVGEDGGVRLGALTPARLHAPSSQPSGNMGTAAETDNQVEAVQCSSPTGSSPDSPSSIDSPDSPLSPASANLPAFGDLLSNEAPKKTRRPYKPKKRPRPYPARQDSRK